MQPAPAGPILVVEADRALGLRLTEQLAADGFAVELARTVEHARVLARESSPKLALIGQVEAPRGAISLLEEIRQASDARATWNGWLPAVVLGRRAHELDALRAFEAGADDFLAPPVGYLELRARVRAILRRSARPPSEPILQVGGLLIDTLSHDVRLHGRVVELRRLEFDLLVHLAREPARVFARQELLRAVWGYRSVGSTRTLDSHASRLRRKLDPQGARRWVVNVWGVGYRLR